jgi:hypothetical protein
MVPTLQPSESPFYQGVRVEVKYVTPLRGHVASVAVQQRREHKILDLHRAKLIDKPLAQTSVENNIKSLLFAE